VTTREVPGDTDEAVELLSSPPTNEDLDDLLEAAAPRRRSKLTVALVAALIFVVGFFAGSMSEKIALSIQEAQAASAEAGDEGTAVSNAGPAVTGRVLMLDDGVVYVERDGGGTVKVRVSEATIVGVSEPGELTELVPGEGVIVHGEISADGSIDASSIQQSRPEP
jgi:hypothetical protein